MPDTSPPAPLFFAVRIDGTPTFHTVTSDKEEVQKLTTGAMTKSLAFQVYPIMAEDALRDPIIAKTVFDWATDAPSPNHSAPTETVSNAD